MMKKLKIVYFFISVTGVIFSGIVNAESTPPKPACSSDQYRAFDFWLGEWEVTAKGKNKPHAKSSITKHNNGCSIHEHYVTSTGYTGNSLNFYDKANNKWHQTWIDNSGNPLYLDGQFKDGAMILLNTSNRITWTKNEAGMVNQVWETTADKGKTWKVIFDGSYKAVDSDKK